MNTVKDNITEAGRKFFEAQKAVDATSDLDARLYRRLHQNAEAQISELVAVLEKIADLHRGPGSALARSALDTMRLLEKEKP